MSCKSRTPKSADTYVTTAPAFARPILERLRALIREAAPELQEVIRWGSPCYKGRSLVIWLGAFKGHVSLTFFQGARIKDPKVLLAHGAQNAANRKAKFRSLDDIPAAAIRALVKEAVRLDANAATSPQPPARRPALSVPDDLAAALRGQPRAAAFFEQLTPSCRREYIEWITSAKRSETRLRRLLQALRMLEAGKKQNAI